MRKPFLQSIPLGKISLRTVQILAAIHLFYTDIAEIRQCQGFSMLPTMNYQGEWVLSSPLPYRSLFNRFQKRPERGDLVIAENPLVPGVTICKRVVGVEGDIVEVEVRRGGTRKWIDGTSGTSDKKGEDGHGEGEVVRSMDSNIVRRKGEEKWVKVPKGHVWLAGDNMSNSNDSRVYGPVPLALIKGKLIMQIWPKFGKYPSTLREYKEER